jgi:uncharacterized protein
MEQTLDAALSRLFGGEAAPAEEVQPAGGRPTAGPGLSPDMRRLIERAVSQFQRAQQLQRQGDWAGYGEQQRQLGQTLKQLQQR